MITVDFSRTENMTVDQVYLLINFYINQCDPDTRITSGNFDKIEIKLKNGVASLSVSLDDKGNLWVL